MLRCSARTAVISDGGNQLATVGVAWQVKLQQMAYKSILSIVSASIHVMCNVCALVVCRRGNTTRIGQVNEQYPLAWCSGNGRVSWHQSNPIVDQSTARWIWRSEALPRMHVCFENVLQNQLSAALLASGPATMYQLAMLFSSKSFSDRPTLLSVRLGFKEVQRCCTALALLRVLIV